MDDGKSGKMFCGVCKGIIGVNSHTIKVDFSTPSKKDVQLIHRSCAEKIVEAYVEILKLEEAEKLEEIENLGDRDDSGNGKGKNEVKAKNPKKPKKDVSDKKDQNVTV